MAPIAGGARVLLLGALVVVVLALDPAGGKPALVSDVDSEDLLVSVE